MANQPTNDGGVKSAEDYHHSPQYVKVKRESNPNWTCICASCEHLRYVINATRKRTLLEAAEIAHGFCGDYHHVAGWIASALRTEANKIP